MAELVDALALGASGVTRESSSLSFRTIQITRRLNHEDNHVSPVSGTGLFRINNPVWGSLELFE